MIFNNLNLNQLRIFEVVFRTKSMTLAAKELHLTQSGVSQHVKSLEDLLDVKLFDRINQRLIPTPTGNQLYQQCSKALHEIEGALLEIQGEEAQLSGTVSIGMPIEFGNNVVLPVVSKFCKKHPFVNVKLHLDFANIMNQALLNGEIDFALVDQYQMDRRIITEKVVDEIVELCIHPDLLKKKGQPKRNRKYFESLEYIAYQTDEPVLRMWFHHHLGNRSLNLNVRATVMDVQGVARLIMNQLGAGALPDHLISKLSKEGQKLYRFKGCGKPLRNTISVAYLRERTFSPVANELLSEIKTSLVKGN